MTIYEIKRRVLASDSGNRFFDRTTLRFFGQTLKSFCVCKGESSNMWLISAPMRDSNGKIAGHTIRVFDGETNKLFLP